MKHCSLLLLSILTVCLCSCGRGEKPPEPEPEIVVVEPEEPPVTQPVPLWRELSGEAVPAFEDGFDKDSLLLAVDRQLNYLKNAKRKKVWRIGRHEVDDQRTARGLRRLREIWDESLDQPTALRQQIAAEFHIMELSFEEKPGILITGYYAPVFEGSLQRDQTYRFPLYARPKDAVLIRPSYFDEAMLQAGPTLRDDRLVARINNRREVVPYFSRAEIDGDDALAGKGLELVYLADYFENFVFQVQGGGFIRLPDGRFVELNYAGKNGLPYTSIGGLLIREGQIPRDKMSMQAIAAWLKANPNQLERVCYANKSYVFYTAGKPIKKMGPEHFPDGVMGFPVSTRRSIATDKRLFPGGWPAFLMGEQTKADGGRTPFSAFVIDQDTGGAIRGAHVDWFLGAGKAAGEDAGRLTDRAGRVLFLVIREGLDI